MKYLRPFLLLSVGSVLSLSADEIKLKSGEVLTGKVLSEGADIVRFEVARSASIKETKIISRADIAEIVKESPDNVKFAEVSKLVPTPSLLNAAAYRTALETGPAAFLRDFPSSPHVEKVKEIQKTLEEELDRVDRGFIKIEEDWISPQDRAEFPQRTESRILLVQFERLASASGVHNQIAAMRVFEAIEKQYAGTPAYARALPLALQLVPALGSQLQVLARDVDYQNAEFERNKATLDKNGQDQVMAARAKEEATIKAAVEQDKKAGAKWVQLNPRSKSSIEEYLKFAAAEFNRLKALDTEAIKTQGERLSAVDDLIAKRELEEAQAALKAATSTGQASGSRSSAAAANTYAGALNAKLTKLIAERTAAQKAEEAAKKAQTVAMGRAKTADGEDNPEGEEGEDKAGEKEDGTEPEAKTAETEGADQDGAEDKASAKQDDFSALSGAKKKEEEDQEEGETRPRRTSRKKAADAEGGSDEAEVAAVVEEEKGGIMKWIIPGVTVLLLVVVVVLKVTGIGSKKKSEEDEEAEEE